MLRRPPRSTRTYTLFPYTTLFRSTAAFRVDRDDLIPASANIQAAFGHDRRCFERNRSRALRFSRPEDPGGLEARQIGGIDLAQGRSEEHTSELQSLMRISYAVFCLKKKKHTTPTN